ncbi:MAG: AMP-binding protein, partial [Planctomycetota bacterium]
DLQSVLAEREYSLPTLNAGDLAYIMYTSGSTGNPKGVQIEHAALTAYCMADIEVYRLQASDRTLQFSTLNFDIAIEEIFPPLLIGSCVVVRPSERSEQANELSAIVNDYGITALHLATAYWHEWVDLMKASGDRVPESLRMVLATGEKVSVEHYRRWLGLCDHYVLWCNAYGPTETTVTATVFVPEPGFDQDNMPIGRPLPGYSAFILDDAMKPVRGGETGQLFIGGNALARGYLNREDLNEKAFREVEFENGITQRLYATGDLARWLDDGQIEFAGRIDHQIKLGSYRIEPGEIEAAIHKHPQVLESLVVYEKVGNQKFLIAYLATGKETIQLEELDGFLRSSLPPYMVPPRYCCLPAFPKTINGKIDRKALPEPGESLTVRAASYVEPRNDLESRLCDIWQDVLNVPQVGIYDDFFALGGSSLLVTRVVTELTNHLGIELPVRDFFANPTVESSAQHIGRLLGIESVGGAACGESSESSAARRRRLPLLHADFVGAEDRQLFHVHYSPPPENAHLRRNHGVLLCHALGNEYTRAYRNVQQLGILLCEAGFDVLRFDYFGTGNSSGCCDDIRRESLLADIKRSADRLLQLPGVDSFSVVGIRLGATLAANCQYSVAPRAGILWDPVIRGQAFLSTLEQLDSYARSSQTRFARRVPKSSMPQLFGHAWPEEKRSSIARLQLPAEPPEGSEWRIVHSNNYATDETGFGSSQANWGTSHVADDIRWHSPDFTESAFASRETNQAIVDQLRQFTK